jgi:uncharacterized protein (DUF302 family)
MSASEPKEIAFTGVQLRVESDKPYDELVRALFDDVGDTPVPIDELPQTVDGWDAYQQLVEPHVGPSGFMFFAQFDHGGWIKHAGIDRKVLRVIIGNPLIAITMLRHDVTAGLFAPVELLLQEEDGGRSSVTYVRPSSLMVVDTNAPLLAAAEDLDSKLAALVAKVTANS